MKKFSVLTANFLLAAVLLFPSAARACAVCLTGAGTGDPLTEAFNWSVLFLMATPYAVVGSIAGWLFYAYRSAARKRGLLNKEAPALRLAWDDKESGR